MNKLLLLLSKLILRRNFKSSPGAAFNHILYFVFYVRYGYSLGQGLSIPLHRQFWIGVVGVVLDATFYYAEKPIFYHDGKYWGMTSTLDKPASEFLENIKTLFEEYVK